MERSDNNEKKMEKNSLHRKDNNGSYFACNQKYINHSILEPVNTIQEWLDVSLWRNISSGIYIIALSILLINMAYFLIQKKYKWLAVIQIILFFNFAFLV